MKVTFKDGSQKEFQKGLSAYEIAMSISSSLAKKSIYAIVNGQAVDIHRPIEEDCVLELKMKEDSFSILNHSCSHLLAAAIKSIYPNAIFGVGPAIEEGFYYDINPGIDVAINEEDFVQIEKQMK
ncbi:MAG: TGS domain-containing protein, partial [Bacilli bacterium]